MVHRGKHRGKIYGAKLQGVNIFFTHRRGHLRHAVGGVYCMLGEHPACHLDRRPDVVAKSLGKSALALIRLCHTEVEKAVEPVAPGGRVGGYRTLLLILPECGKGDDRRLFFDVLLCRGDNIAHSCGLEGCVGNLRKKSEFILWKDVALCPDFSFSEYSHIFIARGRSHAPKIHICGLCITLR